MENQSVHLNNIIPLFPTAIGNYSLNRTITKKELNSILELEKRTNQGNKTSKDNYIFKNIKQLKEIHHFCLTSAVDFFNNIYKPDSTIKLYITQSWINYTENREYHHKHSHPNSIISGVFYFKSIPDDKIFFEKKIQYSRIKINPTEFTPFNSETWWLPCTEGKLYLFDSSVEHTVPENKSSHTRISLSFNTFISGKLGCNENLTELILE